MLRGSTSPHMPSSAELVGCCRVIPINNPEWDGKITFGTNPESLNRINQLGSRVKHARR